MGRLNYMANPKDLDILKKSLSGDWASRVELFKRFFWANAAIRRIGGDYRNVDDFLHDCFTNALRTGHSYNEERSLGTWAESVATWTALERHRFRDPEVAGKIGRIRMCAAMEGDEPGDRARLSSYVPPRSGDGDSLTSRIAALAGEPQFTLLATRGVQKKSWEEAAAAAGRPLNTIGTLSVRTIDRLARFFGAPPPLNEDLEPVFFWIIREDAKARHADPEKPRGRVVAMQLDPAFYSPSPELRRIGLSVPAEVRTITLWQAAMSSAPPPNALRDHLARCNYCADVLRALLLMEQALESGPVADFLLCPGGFTLISTSEHVHKPLEEHLAACTVCRSEQAGLLHEEEEMEKEKKTETTAQPQSAGSARKKIVWAAIGLLVLIVVGYFARSQVFRPSAPPVPTTSPVAATPPEPPQVAVDPRYSSLAQVVPVNDFRWLQSVLPENRSAFNRAVENLQNGHVADARFESSGIADHDPGAQMLYAVILYQQNSISEGYAAVLKAEAMPPRNSFRCWTTLQCALIVGDLKIVEREAGHLSQDPAYAQKAKDLLARAKAKK
jgi:DNA-directed RNA polymerase specialized sigma24 family protein